MKHEFYMKEALIEARKALKLNEVPVGAVIVRDDEIIARGHNLRETNKSPLAHAEIIAMQQAAIKLNTWNLMDCTLYVSVEPCPMCAGAILQAHLGTIVFGTIEPNSGSFGTIIDLSKENFNHKPIVIPNILEEESRALMKDFFKEKRKNMIKVKKLETNEMKTYFSIREKVFVEEQEVDVSLEYDENDEPNRSDVSHIGAFINSKMVGTMRLLHHDKTLVVGRLAVLKENRKDGVGKHLLMYAEKQAENNGYEILELGAQIQAMPFYLKSGYESFGEVFLDADIEHMMMKKDVKKR